MATHYRYTQHHNVTRVHGPSVEQRANWAAVAFGVAFLAAVVIVALFIVPGV